MSKQYASVSELVSDITPELQPEFDQHIAERKLVKELTILRAVQGLSQRDVAKHMGCSHQRICKIENSKDADITLGTLQAYANVLGCKVSIQIIEDEDV